MLWALTTEETPFRASMASSCLLSVSLLLAFLCTQLEQLHLCNGEDHPTVRCRESERRALLGFRQGLQDPSNRLSSWTGQDCCHWAGVGCSNITGHVVRLDLHNWHANYVLNAPFLTNDSGSLGGEISPSLLGLEHLAYLNLSYNYMNWNHIPRFIGSFKRLRFLDLSCSGFRGTVAHELGNVSTLRYLDLSCWFVRLCQLEVDEARWLSGLDSLQHLEMGSVNFSKASNWLESLNLLPELREIVLDECQLPRVPFSLHPLNFTSLEVLHLGYNADLFGDMTELGETLPGRVRNSLKGLHLSGTGLRGPIPDWLGDFKNLKYLYLSRNPLHGPIPASVGSLSNLVVLELWNISLEGVLSEIHFANLTKLKLLDISDNPLIALNVSSDWDPPFRLQFIYMESCNLGPRFPAWLRTQESCTYLYMWKAGISDSMPGWLGNFSTQLEYIDLSYNEIRGKVPNFESKVLYSVDLSHNLLSGPIPLNTGEKVPILKYLSLSGNNITGSIPLSLCNMSQVTALDFSSNHLSGDIPNCWDYASKLQVLDFSVNNLSGGIPDSICSAKSFLSLHLHSNSLFGHIPLSMKNCEGMVILDVSNNKLSGNIPTWLGESLMSLKNLWLQSNMFIGNIPPQLSNLSALQILDLSDNNLSGEIPKSFGNFSAMKVVHQMGEVVVNESFYSDRMLLSLKGRELEYSSKILSVTVRIDLSENCLVGSIPEDLGNLVAMQSLILSGNHLTGNIMKDIGRLKQLVTLDLSRNKLLGGIPSSLTLLDFLVHLNLSYNRLSGRIPYGNRLQTLDDPSIYIGNLDLCGLPLANKCQSAEAPQVQESIDEDDEEGSSSLWFYIGMATGFVLGSWIFWGAMFLKKSWRIAYFCFMDNMYDRLYIIIVVNATRLKKNVLRTSMVCDDRRQK